MQHELEPLDEIVEGDLVVALAIRTPGGGVVLQAMQNHSRQGLVRLSTSLGAHRKLERIDADPRVAVVFHTRDHGRAHGPRFVVVQGLATIRSPGDEPAPGPAAAGLGGWLLREHVRHRAVIEVEPSRTLTWPRPDSPAAPDVGVAAAEEPLDLSPAPEARQPPTGGQAARVRPQAWADRMGHAAQTLVGWVDRSGHPMVRSAHARLDDGGGLLLSGADLPVASCRMGLLAHSFDADLVGRTSVVMTGWFDAGRSRFAPHTERGQAILPMRWAQALGVGIAAKRGLRRAVRHGLVVDGRWVGRS